MSGKDVTFTFRIDAELRDGFVEAARRSDIPAAQLLRQFMRQYVSENSQALAGGSLLKKG